MSRLSQLATILFYGNELELDVHNTLASEGFLDFSDGNERAKQFLGLKISELMDLLFCILVLVALVTRV